METHVVIKLGNKCPYLDAEMPTCESTENYCDGNVAASVYCGARFGVEGVQIDTYDGLCHVEEIEEVFQDDEDAPLYDEYVRTFVEVRR